MSDDLGAGAVVFDPDSGRLPPALDRMVADPDTPVLLLVASDSYEAAPALAIGLAEARAGRGLDTFLVDADLDAPRLHSRLGTDNLEGLVDIFLFGASLRRVAVSPQGQTFHFIPAGGYAPDPAEILGSPRWARITEELHGRRSLLMVFVPAGASGLPALSKRIGQALLLADDPAAQRIADRLHPGCQILATVQAGPAAGTGTGFAGAGAGAGVGAGAGAAAAAPGTDEGPEHDPAVDEAAVDDGGLDDAAVDDAGVDGATIDDAAVIPAEDAPVPPGREPDLSEPPVIRETPGQRSRLPLLLVLMVVALLAAWFGYQHFFAAGPADPQIPLGEAVLPPVSTERGDPVETPLPFSVAVEAHQDLESAMSRAGRLAEAEPDAAFYLAPVSVNGDLFYRLLAGPAADQESAMALMQRLVDGGHKTAMDAWAVRPTTYAFLVAEFETPEEATARVDSLNEAGVPVYSLPLRYEGGQRAFRVYGGAYENEAEAEVMGELLENAGVEARLVARAGEAEG